MVLAQDLRNAVLQAAFNGLLTVREITDSSVFDLIRQIDEEKRANKSKYYPVSEESEKNVPDSWTITKIGNIIIKDLGGGTPSKNNPKFWNGNIPWMSVKDFSNSKNNILNDTIDHISQEGVDNSATNIIDTNAIILCTRMGLGKFCKITQPIAINQDLRAIWLSKKINESYFIYFYSSLTITGTGTTVKGIKKDELFNHLIPIPPIEEQQRIVDRIEELMKKIDEYEKVEKELLILEQKFPNDMKNALLQAAMQGKLTEQLDSDSSVDEMLEAIKENDLKGKVRRHKKEIIIEDVLEEIGDSSIPSTWKWVKLGDISVSNIGLTYKPINISNTGTIVLRSSNIINGQMDYKDVIKVDMDIPGSKMCEIGDILICARNGSKQLVGKAAIIDKNGMAFGAFMAILKSRYNPYIFYFLNSPIFKKQMHKKAGTETINQITQDMLFNCVIPLPPVEEQQRIVERLEQLLPLCETL